MVSILKNNVFKSFTVLGATLVCGYAGQALAQDGPFEFSANVGLYTDYAFRGISQSDEGPVVQGGLDVGHDSGLYAGVWGSNVDFNDGDEANVEIDVYGGYSGAFDSTGYDVGLIYYAYPGADSSLDYDFWEASFGLNHDFELFSTAASVNYSPDYFASSGDAFYVSGDVSVPLPHDISLNGHIGHQWIDDNSDFGTPDYLDWSVGLGHNYEGFDLSLTYVDTDMDEPTDCADGCDTRLIFGVGRSF